MPLRNQPPAAPIVSGRVYRRIPNRDSHFDYDSGRPESAAFEPRPQDLGCLSVFHDRDEALATLEQKKHAGFGLCELDVATLIAETGAGVWVEAAQPGAASSHGRIHNCDSAEVWAVLARIAVVVRRPAKPFA